MSDQHCRRLLGLSCLGIAAQRRRTVGLLALVDDIANLLLDRRLVMVRGRHVTSFISGTVALFLLAQVLLPDSTVLSTVPSDTLKPFMGLLREALPAVRCSKLLFRSSCDGATAAAFHSRCEVGFFRTHLTLLRSVRGLR